MGCKVVGVDINDAVLDSAKEAGADLVYNSRTSPDFVSELRKATNGGAHAACVFSAAQAAYDTAAKILQPGGVLMVIGLPSNGSISFSSFELMRQLYRIKSESTGPPQKMPRAIEFITKHGIRPKVSHYQLEQIGEMIEKMISGQVTERMAVLF